MNAPSKLWKVALVGVGGRGRWAVDLASEDSRLQIVAIVDTSPEILESVRSNLGLPEQAVFCDAIQAMEKSGAEVAIICTPMLTHGPLCKAAFERGLHVLVEKGMSFSWEEAKEMVAAADAASVRFCVAQNYRYLAPMQALASILSQPDHPENPGRVFLIDCIQHRYRPNPGTSTYPYAMVWDMGCHHFDLLLSLFGPIRRVSSRSYRAPWSLYEHEANITAFLEFENGAVCNYMLTHDASMTKLHLSFQGDRGVLRLGSDLDGLQYQPLPTEALRNGVPRPCVVPEQPRDVKCTLDAFIDYLDGGAEPGISGRRNLETMATCAMVCEAAKTGRSIDRSELK